MELDDTLLDSPEGNVSIVSSISLRDAHELTWIEPKSYDLVAGLTR